MMEEYKNYENYNSMSYKPNRPKFFNYQKRRYYIYKRVQSVSLLKPFMFEYVFDDDACLLVLIEEAGDEVLGSI